ncbi:hypothetical protein N7931_02320 [Catenovulum sp. 2E275]|uniref:S16 family serine protease n=1 Tax=Catenovulum sp. 2E275 TaxID=2980497 RepID=UPI0021D202C5|nr:S16 family serine protease [Catenovulum sp. 2E275]MCU4674456.1 hypothetical protein [Catenovulum sp. 2E275]
MTNSMALSLEQLSVQAKIAKMQLSLQNKPLNQHLLLPQLTQFIEKVEYQHFDVYLLTANYPVIPYLNWLGFAQQHFELSSVEYLIGHFQANINGKYTFKSGALFDNPQQSCILSAQTLLQDEKLLDLIGKMISNRCFSTRWLLNDEQAQNIQPHFRHKQIRFDRTIIITGDYESLQAICYLLPSLAQKCADEINEADHIAELKAETLPAFKDFIQTSFKTQLTDEQLNSLIWAQARLVEEQNWFSLDLTYLKRLFSRLNPNFSQADVELAVQDINGFNSSSRLYNFEQILKNTIKVDFSGEVVGQINGLTVVETALAEFGEPSRITANIFVGEGDIGDIERKSELGGNIHAKAMMILSSFVSRAFAKNEPLPISSNIVFEQSYHEVDGDSASLAELYALLSAISNVPIRQNVALTGAIDQLGNVLAVGGVDLKIEGYYVLAKLKAPMQTHHIIIPHANVTHLNLSSDILNAVSQGSLKIHAIKHVTEAADILTGLPAESDDGESLFAKVREELEHFGQELEQSRSILKKLALFFTKSR